MKVIDIKLLCILVLHLKSRIWPPPPLDNGGMEEERSVDSTVVSSSCMQVCGLAEQQDPA